MRMFIAFSLSFVSSLLRMRKYYSCKIRSHLCMRSSLRDDDGGGDGRKARKEFHTNSKRRRTFKNLFFIKPKRINLFHSVSSSILPPFVLLHGRLLHRQLLRCSVSNISFYNFSSRTYRSVEKGTRIECERRTKNLQFKFPI